MIAAGEDHARAFCLDRPIAGASQLGRTLVALD